MVRHPKGLAPELKWRLVAETRTSKSWQRASATGDFTNLTSGSSIRVVAPTILEVVRPREYGL